MDLNALSSLGVRPTDIASSSNSLSSCSNNFKHMTSDFFPKFFNKVFLINSISIKSNISVSTTISISLFFFAVPLTYEPATPKFTS